MGQRPARAVAKGGGVMMTAICLGLLAVSLAFGVAWINTRIAGLFWVSANFLGYQWSVEASRLNADATAFAANVTLGLGILYLSIMGLSGIGAAHVMKREQARRLG